MSNEAKCITNITATCFGKLSTNGFQEFLFDKSLINRIDDPQVKRYRPIVD